MAHTVWNLGSQTGSGRLQPRQFVAGIQPAQEVFIGRGREPKRMVVILDAWIEPIDIGNPGTGASEQGYYALALGKDPLNDALILPVGRVLTSGDATNNLGGVVAEQQFKANGTMWATQYIAIDIREVGGMTLDVDVHLDWTVALVDWWTWFASWNRLIQPERPEQEERLQ